MLIRITSLFSFFLFVVGPALLGNNIIRRDSLPAIEKIIIVGNNVTKDKIILRELTFSEGDILTGDELHYKMQRSRENLLNTSLFNFVNISREITSHGLTILIVVTERWYIWPVILFEHADRNLPAWLKDPDIARLNYGMQLNWNNFRGRNEILQLKARFGYKEQFSINYFKPNIDKEQKHGISLRFDKFRQHEIVFRSGANGSEYLRNDSAYLLESVIPTIIWHHRPGLYFSQELFLKYTDLTFNDPDFSEEYLGIRSGNHQHYFTFGWSGEIDYRDSWIYPLKGYMLNLRLSQMGTKKFSFPKTYFGLQASYNKPLLPRLYSGTALKIRLAKDEILPVYFRQALGYNTYLRGFEYYIIDGNSYFVSVNNLKYALIPRIDHRIKWIPLEQFNKIHFSVYGGGFFDIGWVQGRYYSTNGDELLNKLLFSGGLGIDFVSYYDQVLRFEFTLNSLKEPGFYLHFEMPFTRW